VVDRADGHGRVDAVVVERQGLGPGGDGGDGPRRTLGAHRRRGLDGDHVAVARLIRAGAGADVDHGPGVSESGVDLGGDARVGTAHRRVPRAMAVVVEAGSHGRQI
jgi:hypothetical protein